jgi:hypothetical protein
MEFPIILIAVAVTFALCYLADKGFTKLFRSKPQHVSGKALRLNKRFASVGLVLVFLALAVFIGNTDGNTALTVGGIILVVVGIGLVVYYLSTGIFYDDDTFLYTTFGKQSRAYRYSDVLHQQLYIVQGGSFIIELHMRDGSAVQVLSQMPDYDKFLNHACLQWSRQNGPGSKDHICDPDNNIWFPEKEA